MKILLMYLRGCVKMDMDQPSFFDPLLHAAEMVCSQHLLFRCFNNTNIFVWRQLLAENIISHLDCPVLINVIQQVRIHSAIQEASGSV